MSSYDDGAAFNEGVRALTTMFPDVDPRTIRAVLDARDGHVESAVEKLLAMSRRGGGGGVGGDAPGAMGMSPMRCARAARGVMTMRDLDGDVIFDDANGTRTDGVCARVCVAVRAQWTWVGGLLFERAAAERGGGLAVGVARGRRRRFGVVERGIRGGGRNVELDIESDVVFSA